MSLCSRRLLKSWQKVKLLTMRIIFSIYGFNPSHIPYMSICNIRLLKSLWQKVKLLIMSLIFSIYGFNHFPHTSTFTLSSDYETVILDTNLRYLYLCNAVIHAGGIYYLSSSNSLHFIGRLAVGKKRIYTCLEISRPLNGCHNVSMMKEIIKVKHIL